MNLKNKDELFKIMLYNRESLLEEIMNGIV